MCNAKNLNGILRKITAGVLRRRRISIAIDTAEIPYFGTRDEGHYSTTRRCYVHRYVVAAAIGSHRGIPLFIRLFSMFDSRADSVEAVLRDIERAYMNCGFFSVLQYEKLSYC